MLRQLTSLATTSESVGLSPHQSRDRQNRSCVTTLSPMAMGKRKRLAKQASMWVATQDLPRSASVLTLDPPMPYALCPMPFRIAITA